MNELSLRDHVRITGARNDVPVILSASDIFVHLSPDESDLGTAIQEAMSMSVACLLTNAGRTAELFTHNEYAHLVPTKNPEATATGLIELLTNTKLREKLQSNGPVFLKKHGCTKQAIKKQLTSLYLNLINRSKFS